MSDEFPGEKGKRNCVEEHGRVCGIGIANVFVFVLVLGFVLVLVFILSLGYLM